MLFAIAEMILARKITPTGARMTETALLKPTKQALPRELPRFVESWRAYIDDEYGRRIFTGEWSDRVMFNRGADDLALLLKAGKVGVIASTAPDSAHSYAGRREWYGDQNYPVLYWHWKPSADGWDWPSDVEALEWLNRRDIKGGLGLFKLGPREEWRG
jgi:hypothetical protein